MVLRAISMLIVLLFANSAAAMQVSSTDIADGSTISQSQIYPRCGGANISPQVAWSGAPKETKSFVVTMIDQDVKPSLWSHWIVVDVPPTTSGLERGAKTMPLGARQITTNFGDDAYGGPCPPAGTGVHHYRLTVWAMKEKSTAIAAGANAAAVQSELEKTALDSASLTGALSR